MSRQRRWGLWLGLAVLAAFAGAAIWISQIDLSESRSARLELRHESRDLVAEGPLVSIGTVWEDEAFEPLALAPGEAIVTDVSVTEFRPWEYTNSGLKVEFGKIPAGWVFDEFECTEHVGLQPTNSRQSKLGFIAQEWTTDEVEITCTLWTRAEQIP